MLVPPQANTRSSSIVLAIIFHLIAGKGGTAPRQTPLPVTSSTDDKTPFVFRPPIIIIASGVTHSKRCDHLPIRRPLVMQRASLDPKDTKPCLHLNIQDLPEDTMYCPSTVKSPLHVMFPFVGVGEI